MGQIVTPQTYAIVKRMTVPQMSRWARSIYMSGFEDAERQIMGDADEATVITEDGLRKILLGVKGIGPKKAEQIINKICSKSSENIEI